MVHCNTPLIFIKVTVSKGICFPTDEQLRVTELEPAARETCEEESEVAANTICTQEKTDKSILNGVQKQEICQVRH